MSVPAYSDLVLRPNRSITYAISAGINFRFSSSCGRTDLDGVLYGGASALGDVLKAAIPFLIAVAVKGRRWGQAIAGIIVWITCVAVSFSSATGFGIASNDPISPAHGLRPLIVDDSTMQLTT